MDLQSFEKITKFDETFNSLLEVKGNLLKKIRFRKCVKEAKDFYKAYVKKCNEYNQYIDFFEPLFGYLIYCGFGYDKSAEYLSEIRKGILEYLNMSLPDEMVENIDGKDN